MLNLYRSVYHFAECLRCADAAADTEAEWRFVQRIRWRQTRHHPCMKMTMAEHVRLTKLAVEGGWDGSPCVEAEETTA